MSDTKLLQVRDPSDSTKWIPIPAIRGTSVKFLSAPSTFAPTSEHYGGWTWTIFDENIAANDTTYNGTVMTVYNGAIASSEDIKVDGYGLVAGTTGIQLHAVQYDARQTYLDDSQKSQARTNINAMKNIVVGDSGTIIKSNGTEWVAAVINEVPAISTEGYVLTVTNNTYQWGAIPTISAAAISTLFNT